MGAAVAPVRAKVVAGLGVALTLMIPACSFSGSARPATASSPSPARQGPPAVRLSSQIVRTASESVRVPAGWHGRVTGVKVQGIDLVAPCGRPVITIRERDQLPARARTALSYAEMVIAHRGTKSGVASSPFPSEPLQGTPAVQVSWNSRDIAILAVHATSGYIVEASTPHRSCAALNLPSYLAAIAGSWLWTQTGS